MTDRKIILAELQNIQRFFEAKADMSIGDGKMKLLLWANVCRDALELLKAVPPDAREVWIGSNGAFHWEYTCGACGCGIMRNDRWKTKYCPQCGKAVKWDD